MMKTLKYMKKSLNVLCYVQAKFTSEVHNKQHLRECNAKPAYQSYY